MKKTILRAKRLIRKQGGRRTQLVVMFQAPIGKQPLDILVDETYKEIMLTKVDELMLDKFFAKAAYPDAPEYELDQFFATQYPLTVEITNYSLCLFPFNRVMVAINLIP